MEFLRGEGWLGYCLEMDDELLLRRLAKLDAVISALRVEIEQIRLVLAEAERILAYGALKRVPMPD